MDRAEFLNRLEAQLLDVPQAEREEALQYYEDYLNDAGDAGDFDILQELGTPEEVADSIRNGLRQDSSGAGERSGQADENWQDSSRTGQLGDSGYFSENGYVDREPQKEELQRGSPKVFDKLRIPEDNVLRQVITISNPLGEDYSIMRTSTLNGMLSSLATNYNRRNKDVRLYELGNVYLPKALPLTELPDERTMFTLGMYGTGDFFDMKGVCEEFFEKIGMKKKMEYDPASGKPFLHPGRQADMVYEGTVVGYLGEVHPLVADNYGIGERAYIAMIDIKSVLEFANFDRKFTGIAKYPAVTRDISMLVPKQVLAGQIEDILAQRGGKILESYQLFDIYEGSQIKGGYKSMAYALVFRDHDKTLEESEISAAMKKILNGLEGLGIELRS